MIKNEKEQPIGPERTSVSTVAVSVVIPTYNRAWALPRAIDSVLSQTVASREIIVVDDGSTDDTAKVLATYGTDIRVVTRPNQGVSAARNAGIRISRGALIAFLDSDDLWLPDKLACQVAFFEALPEAMICQTQELWIRRGRRVNPHNKHRKPSGMIFFPSLYRCLVSPSAVMMKKTLFDLKGYFNEAYPVCEDYDLWLRVSADLPVYLIDRPLTVKHGGHEDQLSAAHSQDRYRIASLLELVRSGELTPAQRVGALAALKEKCRIYGNGCLKRGRDEEGHAYLLLWRRVLSPDVTGSLT